jgi:hypothetical protein
MQTIITGERIWDHVTIHEFLVRAAPAPSANFQAGGDGYDTLEEAVAAVATGGIITMLQDVTLENTVALNKSKTYTLDLGGYTLTGNVNGCLAVSSWTVRIQNGAIISTFSDAYGNGSGLIVSGGTVTLDDLTINCTVATYASAISMNGGRLSILSGSYTGADDAVYRTGGTLTITAGLFENTIDASGDGTLCNYTGPMTSSMLAKGSFATPSLPNTEKEVTVAIDPVVPVTGITPVQMTAAADTPFVLSGTVNPANATNQTIVWSLTDPGTTGATLDVDTFIATAVGETVVTATVSNGSLAWPDYTQNYTIHVYADTSGEEGYDVWVNGARFTDDNLEIVCGEGTAVYDPGTKTLTLTNATIDTGCVIPAGYYAGKGTNAAIFTEEDIHIVLIGDNVITDTGSTGIDSYGAKPGLANVSVSGPGSLSITQTSAEFDGYGFYVRQLTLDGVTLYINSASAGLWTSHGLTAVGSTIVINNTGATYSGIVVNERGAGAVFDHSVVVSNRQPISSDGWSPPFIPVADITGVPATVTQGTPLTLTGVVSPANATNQAIVWSVKDAGDTGATTTDGNTLSATTAGDVVVTATIVNGATEATDYTQNFTVTVNPAAPPLTPSGLLAGGEDVSFDGDNSGAGWSFNAAARTLTVSDNITITGAISGQTEQLTVDVANGKTVNWQADYSGGDCPLYFTGAGGNLILSDCGIQSASDFTTLVYSEGSITINDGANIVYSGANGHAVKAEGTLVMNAGYVCSTEI